MPPVLRFCVIVANLPPPVPRKISSSGGWEFIFVARLGSCVVQVLFFDCALRLVAIRVGV